MVITLNDLSGMYYGVLHDFKQQFNIRNGWSMA